jgi:hypothetical protein
MSGDDELIRSSLLDTYEEFVVFDHITARRLATGTPTRVPGPLEARTVNPRTPASRYRTARSRSGTGHPTGENSSADRRCLLVL